MIDASSQEPEDRLEEIPGAVRNRVQVPITARGQGGVSRRLAASVPRTARHFALIPNVQGWPIRLGRPNRPYPNPRPTTTPPERAGTGSLDECRSERRICTGRMRPFRSFRAALGCDALWVCHRSAGGFALAWIASRLNSTGRVDPRRSRGLLTFSEVAMRTPPRNRAGTARRSGGRRSL